MLHSSDLSHNIHEKDCWIYIQQCMLFVSQVFFGWTNEIQRNKEILQNYSIIFVETIQNTLLLAIQFMLNIVNC